MHTVQVLTRLVEDHQILAYGLIFLGLVFEGEVTLISAGVLAHLGALNFWVALGFIFTGGIVKTFVGYYFGRFLFVNHNYNKLVMYIERRVMSVLPRFRQRPFWSIFFSKFITGVNYLIIVFAGFKRVKLKTYLKAEFLSTLIWAPLLLSMGYYFSYAALHISREIGRFLLIIVLFTICFLLLDKLIAVLFEVFEYSKDKDSEKVE